MSNIYKARIDLLYYIRRQLVGEGLLPEMWMYFPSCRCFGNICFLCVISIILLNTDKGLLVEFDAALEIARTVSSR